MFWIVAIFLFILLYLLLAPFFLEIDSERGLFRFRFHRLASGSLVINDNTVYAQLRVAFWRKQIDLLTIRPEKKSQIVKLKKKQTKKISFHKIIRVMQTFRVKKLFITFDTGNMPLNGILYPMVFAMRLTSNRNISVNFLGENKFILQIQNNAARILWAFIKS